jgi:hypothetical protein
MRAEFFEGEGEIYIYIYIIKRSLLHVYYFIRFISIYLLRGAHVCTIFLKFDAAGKNLRKVEFR